MSPIHLKSNLLFFLLLISQLSFAQENKSFVLDKDFFLLGATQHIIGKWKGTKNNESINSFYETKKPLLFYLFTTFKKEYPDLKIDAVEGKTYLLNSNELAKKVNSYYNWIYDDGVTNEASDSLFRGELNPKIFKTNSQKVSFLLGAYMRCGEKEKNSCVISLVNESEKFKIVLRILKEIQCKKIRTKITNGIPSGFIIYFEPSCTFNNILAQVEEFVRVEDEKLK